MEPECFVLLEKWIEGVLGRPLTDDDRASLSPYANQIWKEGEHHARSKLKQALIELL